MKTGSPAMQDQKTTVSEKEVLITRIFDAAPALVFKAWTSPQHLMRWYAPEGCIIEFRKLDFREGGYFLSCIRNPAFHDCWCVGEYKEIKEGQRIVFSMAVADQHGNRISAAAAGMDPQWPEETIVSVDFTDENGKTKLVLKQSVAESLAKQTGAYPSWLSMFDRLADELMTNNN